MTPVGLRIEAEAHDEIQNTWNQWDSLAADCHLIHEQLSDLRDRLHTEERGPTLTVFASHIESGLFTGSSASNSAETAVFGA